MWYKQGRVNAFNAVAVSPKRKYLALYVQFHHRTLRGEEVVRFLKPLLRHLRGPVVLLWDRGPIHRRQLVQEFLHRSPRVQAEYFPASAPELNPAEYVWTRLDDTLANGTPRNEQELTRRLRSSMQKLKASQSLVVVYLCLGSSLDPLNECDFPFTNLNRIDRTGYFFFSPEIRGE